MTTQLLKGGQLVELWPPSLAKADLRIEHGLIVARAASLRPRAGDKVLDLKGKIVMPGMVCAHTHLYSALARGMPGPAQPPRNFVEILKKVWWKLDRALDREAIYYSALIGAIEAARAGTTLVIDHHASPSFIRGALDTVREALSTVGLRGILCYETTDRGGEAELKAGLQENQDFITNVRHDEMLRGMVGAHAAFTLGFESLRACGALADKLGCGVHVHVAEDRCDAEAARRRFRKSLVARLRESDILKPASILAHGTHLEDADLNEIQEAQSWLVHNPRSNMNNAVGYAPTARFGANAALGTDGISSDMFDEIKWAFFKAQDAGRALTLPDVIRLSTGGARLASTVFNKRFGSLRAGAVADLIILDYPSPTPLHPSNLFGHMIFGISAAHVESVMVNGRFVVRNRTFPKLDLEAIYREARRVAAKLWRKLVSHDH
ncbi:MAG: putative aminohydrolase SsnA [Acidobacteria bacterium]|nr:putative aminohydrolase SsnA [Acidobacteriota bacterium]MBI3656932.1 putative aminohydrolase SsnA [Acidobacteriota bacterium]